MRLTENIYLVGGGDYGLNLSHRLDCNTYVIDGGDELALVDAGFGPGTEEIVENIRRRFREDFSVVGSDFDSLVRLVRSTMTVDVPNPSAVRTTPE